MCGPELETSRKLRWRRGQNEALQTLALEVLGHHTRVGHLRESFLIPPCLWSCTSYFSKLLFFFFRNSEETKHEQRRRNRPAHPTEVNTTSLSGPCARCPLSMPRMPLSSPGPKDTVAPCYFHKLALQLYRLSTVQCCHLHTL